MPDIRDRNELAALPEPRYLHTAPRWLRRFAVAMLLLAAAVGGGVALAAFSAGSVPLGIGGAAACALCIGVLAWGRPDDWRSWLSLAATRDGLYLVAKRRRVVFVPWRDVVALDVDRRHTVKGYRTYPRLTLRMPAERWALFGGLAAISGSGTQRQYLLSDLGVPGDTVIAAVAALRDGDDG